MVRCFFALVAFTQFYSQSSRGNGMHLQRFCVEHTWKKEKGKCMYNETKKQYV